MIRLICWSWLVWGVLNLGIQTVLSAADTGIDWSRMFDGDVIVTTVVHPEGFSGVRALFVVSAPRERIWHTLLDYDNFPRIYQGIEKVQVLEHTPAGAQVEFWVDAVFKKLHYVLSRRYDDPGRRITWTQITGDLKRLEGSWEIRDTPRAEQYLLVYESYVEMNGGPPAVFLRWVALQRTREMGERLRNWIEGRPPTE